MKYKVSKKDLYLYQKVTQYLIDNPLSIDSRTDSPYTNISLALRADSVRGYGRRNHQREALERDRGRVVVLRHIDTDILVGQYSVVKNVMKMYITSNMSEEIIKAIKELTAHLMYHEITVEVSTLEKARSMAQKVWQMGDRIQREGGRNGRSNYDEW